MVKILSTLIATFVTVTITGIVFAQGASTPITAIGAPASAGGAPAIAGSYTSGARDYRAIDGIHGQRIRTHC